MDRLRLILIINISLLALEMIGGFLSGSIALLSDAGHMLTDTLAVGLAAAAAHWSKQPATGRRTFGHRRAEILAALANGAMLTGLACVLLYQAGHRLVNPAVINTGLMLPVAVIGLLGNIAGLMILHGHHADNLNIRGVFLHIAGDTLSSVGVIAGGLIVRFTGWAAADAIAGMIIAALILWNAWRLVFDAGDILLESAPRDIELDDLSRRLSGLPGIRGVHELRVWTIGPGLRAMSAHIETANITTREGQLLTAALRAVLKDRFHIDHSTLELECDACASGPRATERTPSCPS